MGVSVVAEGVAPPVCARYKFCDPMLIEVVASPLRVLLKLVSWVIPDTGKSGWCVQSGVFSIKRP